VKKGRAAEISAEKTGKSAEFRTAAFEKIARMHNIIMQFDFGADENEWT
jgi:hypothetical protein